MTERLDEGLAGGSELDALAINTLRALAIDAVEKANSGHPGMPLGAAPMAHVLWTRHLKFDPPTPSGRIAIASCSARVTARCFSTACCIWQASTCGSRS